MKKLIALAAATLLAAGAQAATVSYSFPNVSGNMEIDRNGTLGLFDTNLGTLTGAVLTFDAAITGTIQLTYGDSSVSANVRGTNGSDVGFGSTLSAVDSLFNGIEDLSLSYSTGFIPMTPNTVYNSAVLSDSETLVFDLGSALASLGAAGGGTFGLSCVSISTLGITGGGGFAGGDQATQGGCGASIVYTYDADVTPPAEVPEPGTLSLVGLAALGLAARSRRKPQ